MKRALLSFAVSMSMFLAPQVFAGSESMGAKLAEAGSTANVEIVALQQKLANCINTARNEGFKCDTYVGCSERKHYVTSCMNGVNTQVQYASINRKLTPANTDIAVSDFNKMLQETPTAAGNE